MIKCSKCGYENQDNGNFCQNCGLSLNSQVSYNENRNSTNNILKRKSKKVEIAVLMAIFLPGFSYFYLEYWYRGLLYFTSYIIMFFYFAVLGALYSLVYTMSYDPMVLFLIIFCLIIYFAQIYDVFQLTKKINNGTILFIN